MSVRAWDKVWKLSSHGGTELLVLLAVADHADEDGRAYPSVGALATKCRMTTRNVNHILRALQASGELDVQRNEGPYGTNRYRIRLESASPLKPTSPLKQPSPPEAGFTPEAPFTLKPTSSTPEAGFPIPLKPTSDEPSLNRQEPNTRTRRAPSASVAGSHFPEVDAQVLKDWEIVRKAKRVGPVTATVAKKVRAEAAKADLPIQQVVELCCARGWASFNASWDRGDGAAKASNWVLNSDHVFGAAE